MNLLYWYFFWSGGDAPAADAVTYATVEAVQIVTPWVESVLVTVPWGQEVQVVTPWVESVMR